MYAKSKIGLPEFDELPVDVKNNVREEIKHQCGWKSDSHFWKKKSGKVKIWPAEVFLIKEILSGYDIKLKN